MLHSLILHYPVWFPFFLGVSVPSLISSLLHWSFHTVVLGLLMFVVFTVFFLVVDFSCIAGRFFYHWATKEALVVDFKLIVLWSKKISIFLNLLRPALWPSMWSVLESVSCMLDDCVFSFWLSFSLLSSTSTWSEVPFKACVYLLIFCLDDLSIVEIVMLKSPTIIVLLFISPSMAVNIYLMYWGAPMSPSYIFTIVTSSSWIDPLIIT